MIEYVSLFLGMLVLWLLLKLRLESLTNIYKIGAGLIHFKRTGNSKMSTQGQVKHESGRIHGRFQKQSHTSRFLKMDVCTFVLAFNL